MNILIKVLYFVRYNMEAFIWLTALILLAFTDPYLYHFSLCPISNMGFEFCPGCGLGHAISFLFRGEILKSIQTHPLGILAVVLLTIRITTVFKNYRNNQLIYKTK